MYKLNNNGVIRLSDGANIPENNGNTDWQEYLLWVAEGNAPEPIPQPTNKELLAAELASLNKEYQDDLFVMKQSWSVIGIVDGVTEETKKAALRSQWETRKAEYLNAVSTARAKYPI